MAKCYKLRYIHKIMLFFKFQRGGSTPNLVVLDNIGSFINDLDNIGSFINDKNSLCIQYTICIVLDNIGSFINDQNCKT